MSKSVLIIDTPECCNMCNFWFSKATDPVGYRCMAKQKYIENLGSKPAWCPLREFPQRKTINNHDDYFDGVNVGFNICLDEITGGAKDEK